MATLTVLEDRLRDTGEQAGIWLAELAQSRQRLQQAMMAPTNCAQYQQLTLLLEAVIQAEDIINVIHYRYHNAPPISVRGENVGIRGGE